MLLAAYGEYLRRDAFDVMVSFPSGVALKVCLVQGVVAKNRVVWLSGMRV